jgi:hypothetical protein
VDPHIFTDLEADFSPEQLEELGSYAQFLHTLATGPFVNIPEEVGVLATSAEYIT